MVLQSFPRPRPTTNPYLRLLARSIAATPGTRLRTFSWWAALLGRYDVFHVHWPEILGTGHSPAKTLLRQLLTLALLVRLRLRRTPVVRTLHNVGPVAGASRRLRLLLRLLDSQTTLVIALNPVTPVPPGAPVELIPHGHYRDWYARPDPLATQPGRLSFVGLIRPYKNVEGLLRAFRGLAGDVSLHVAGRPTPELAELLPPLAAADPRVRLTLEHIGDEELVRVVGTSELVVLPYRELHNSGGALTALSLGRPVLVPHNDVTERLAAEVGPGWVLTYQGELTAADLARALAAVRRPRAARPDLSGHGWELAGQRHVAAYRRALELSAAGPTAGAGERGRRLRA